MQKNPLAPVDGYTDDWKKNSKPSSLAKEAGTMRGHAELEVEAEAPKAKKAKKK